MVDEAAQNIIQRRLVFELAMSRREKWSIVERGRNCLRGWAMGVAPEIELVHGQDDLLLDTQRQVPAEGGLPDLGQRLYVLEVSWLVGGLPRRRHATEDQPLNKTDRQNGSEEPRLDASRLREIEDYPVEWE